MTSGMRITPLVMILLLTPAVAFSASGLDDFFKTIFNQTLTDSALHEDEIVKGLRQALEIGTRKAVTAVSRTDGYFKHPPIKIRLPEKMQRIENLMRKFGFGSQVDTFVLSMNRAAEKAAPEAKTLFFNALKQMTFDDARRILDGRQDEATRYFREKTETALDRRFRPIIHETMNQVGATRAYRQLDDRLRQLPFTEGFRFDLDEYVTREALNGLFFMVADQERLIREDPAARVTELLKKVFARPAN